MISYAEKPCNNFFITEEQLITILTEGADIQSVYEKYYKDKYSYDFVVGINQFDPTSKDGTQKGKFLPWLLKQFGNYNTVEAVTDITGYDADLVKEMLTWFMSRGKLLKDANIDFDINHYSVEALEELYTEQKDKLFTQAEIRKQADVVFNSPEWEIIIPKTKAASMLFGAHTKWCTAAKDSNMFDSYNREDAHLYINIDKVNNKKYQIFITNDGDTDDFEARDEEDEEISVKDIGMPKDAWNWYLEHISNSEQCLTKPLFPPKGSREILYDEDILESVYLVPEEDNTDWFCVMSEGNKRPCSEYSYKEDSVKFSNENSFILYNYDTRDYDFYTYGADDYRVYDRFVKYQIVDDAILIALNGKDEVTFYSLDPEKRLWKGYFNQYTECKKFHVLDGTGICIIQTLDKTFIIQNIYEDTAFAYDVYPVKIGEYQLTWENMFKPYKDQDYGYFIYRNYDKTQIYVESIEEDDGWNSNVKTVTMKQLKSVDSFQDLKKLIGLD